jgi:hypothetical protein
MTVATLRHCSPCPAVEWDRRGFDHAADLGSPAGAIGSSTSAIGFAGRDASFSFTSFVADT